MGSASAGANSNLIRNNRFTPPGNHGEGSSERSVVGSATASMVSRSGALLVPAFSSSSSLQANAPRPRPMTGLARSNNSRTTTSSASASLVDAATTAPIKESYIVKSAGYYKSIIQTKITDIVHEIQRLQYETEMANGQSKPRMALQKKHDDLMSAVQKLEGSLADYNIAREHFRLGSSPGDIKHATSRIIASNKTKEKEIDSVFYKRKKVEDDIASVRAELQRRQLTVEEANKGGNHGDDIDLVDEYRTLVNQIEAIAVETEQQEDETVLLRHKLKMIMMKSNEDGVADRDIDASEHMNVKDGVESLRKRLSEVEEDIELALMTDDKARDHLLGKIDSAQLNTTELEEESMQLETEVTTLQEMYKKLLSDKIHGGTVKVYNSLLQKDASLKQCLDEELPKLKSKLEDELTQVESNIELIRNDICEKGRMLELELPSNEEMELMKDEMTFTGKNLDANQETMVLLQQQKKKRMDEVCVLYVKCFDTSIFQDVASVSRPLCQLAHVNTLDEQIKTETQYIVKQSLFLQKGIEKYSNLAEVQDFACTVRECLQDMLEKYSRALQLVGVLGNASHLNIGKIENSSEWKELQDLTSRIQIHEQDLLTLYKQARLSETNSCYGDLKVDCLRLVDKMNQFIVRKYQNSELLSNPRYMRS